MFGFISFLFGAWFFLVLLYVCFMNLASFFHPQNFVGYITSFFGLIVSLFSMYVFCNKAFGLVIPFINVSLIGTLGLLLVANFILNIWNGRYFASDEDFYRTSMVTSITVVSGLVSILSAV